MIFDFLDNLFGYSSADRTARRGSTTGVTDTRTVKETSLGRYDLVPDDSPTAQLMRSTFRTLYGEGTRVPDEFNYRPQLTIYGDDRTQGTTPTETSGRPQSTALAEGGGATLADLLAFADSRPSSATQRAQTGQAAGENPADAITAALAVINDPDTRNALELLASLTTRR